MDEMDVRMVIFTQKRLLCPCSGLASRQADCSWLQDVDQGELPLAILGRAPEEQHGIDSLVRDSS
jgi:hypothetical protein